MNDVICCRLVDGVAVESPQPGDEVPAGYKLNSVDGGTFGNPVLGRPPQNHDRSNERWT